MFFGQDSFSTRFNAKHLHGFILQEGVEQSDCVGTAAHARDEQVGKPLFLLENLSAGLIPNDSLKVADHHGIWMSSVRGSQDIMSVTDIRYPVAHRLVDRF